MVSRKPSVLIVDDEQVVCDFLHDELSDLGYLCTIASNGKDALTKLLAYDFDVALLDIRLPGISGMKVLAEMRPNHLNTLVVMITAVNDVNTAVEAIKLGASDYLVKPFGIDRVFTSVRKALEDSKHSVGEKECKPPPHMGGKEAEEESTHRIDAIAFGVEANLDSIDGHSSMVTERTIDVARELGIAEAEIQQWAATRAKIDEEKRGRIKYLLSKLERSPLAQDILGMLSEVYRYKLKSSESEN
jgi:putative two-component system response regulator